MAKTLFAAQRLNAFLFDPEDLVIVDDEEHPLFDPRGRLAPDPSMVRSIISKGVIEPIVARREGLKAIVVAGRRRVICAREANKILRSQGEEPIKVPVVARKGDENDAMDVMILENEQRVDDDITAKARKAARLHQRGRTEEQIADVFGVSHSTVKNWLGLLELAAPVQKAVAEGRVRMSDAVRELGKLDKAEQVTAMAKLEQERPTRAAAKANGVSKKRGTSPVARIKKIRQALEADEAVLAERDRILISWILGKATHGELAERFPRLHAALGV